MITNQDSRQSNHISTGIKASAATFLGGTIYYGITFPALSVAIFTPGAGIAANLAFWSTVSVTAPALIPLSLATGVIIGGASYVLNSDHNEEQRRLTP